MLLVGWLNALLNYQHLNIYFWFQYLLPSGIEELCFPDSHFWQPHPPELSLTYSLILTGPDGSRTFGFCRRIQPEGDDLCLPLAICILTKHRARGLYSQVYRFVLFVLVFIFSTLQLLNGINQYFRVNSLKMLYLLHKVHTCIVLRYR